MNHRAGPLRNFVTSLRQFDWSELRYLSACGYWPFAVYVAVSLVSVLVVLLLCYLVLVPAMRSSWHHAHRQAAMLEIELAALREQTYAYSARNASVAGYGLQQSYLHRHLRPGNSMPAVLDRLSAVAASRGVEVVTMRPASSWQQAGLRAFEIEIQLHADKGQLAAFVGDIQALPFALAVKQTDWNMMLSQGRMTLFLLIDDNGFVHGNEAIAGAKGDGAEMTETSAGDAVGPGWQRVGLIQRGDRYLEVLRDARGETRRRAGQLAEVTP
jgi:Tfp pilus assembly protein PilO